MHRVPGETGGRADHWPAQPNHDRPFGPALVDGRLER
jgi:hypothetical protein